MNECRLLGGALIVVGLYSVLWGKYKEYKDKEAEEILEPVKEGNGQTVDIEANPMPVLRSEESRMVVAVSAPTAAPPMLAVEAPRV